MEDVLDKQIDSPKHTLYTVAEFCRRHSFLTQGGLRFQIFNAKENGLAESGAIVRVGRKVLIDEEAYFRWIDSLQKNGGKGIKRED